MWLKNKNTKFKNKNMRCEWQMRRWIFIMLMYVNVNIKKKCQGYGVRLCLGSVLNKLKEIKGPTFIYTSVGS
jgi:hypothetical protein